MKDVTRILTNLQPGDPRAAAQLLPIVYDELRQLAAQKLAQEAPGQTLQPTALVHEAFLRLLGDQKFDNQGHFFAAAAEAMRRILVDNARRKKAVKHGGDVQHVELAHGDVPVRPLPDEIIALDEAVTRLTEEDPDAAQIISLPACRSNKLRRPSACRAQPLTGNGASPGLGCAAPWAARGTPRPGDSFFGAGETDWPRFPHCGRNSSL